MKRGFTLLELLIVVIIVGILASIAVPQFFRVAERARSAEGVAILGALRSSQLRYYSLQADWTGDVTELDMDVESTRFFADPVANDPGQVFDGTGMLGSIQRNATQYPGDKAAPYRLEILQNGTINCLVDTTLCGRIGY